MGVCFWTCCLRPSLHLWIADQVRNDGAVLVWICCYPVLWIPACAGMTVRDACEVLFGDWFADEVVREVWTVFGDYSVELSVVDLEKFRDCVADVE